MIFGEGAASPTDSAFFVDEVGVTDVFVVVAEGVFFEFDVLAAEEVGFVEIGMDLGSEGGEEEGDEVGF